MIGPVSVHEAMEMVLWIQERWETFKSHQKSYIDVRKRELQFSLDDWVFLKVLPIKLVMRFGKKGKMIP